MSEGMESNPYESPQSGSGPDPSVAGKVTGPAIGLMVTAGIGMALQAVLFLRNLLGAGIGAAGVADDPANAMAMISGTGGMVMSVVGIAVGVVVFMGAMKMQKLESYGFSMAASILAMIPCVSPCCFIGLPIGIWALVVLSDASVKAAFK